MSQPVPDILESTRHALEWRARFRCIVNAGLVGLVVLLAGEIAGRLFDLGPWGTVAGCVAFLLVLAWGWKATQVDLARAGLFLDGSLGLKERAVTVATCRSSLLSVLVEKDFQDRAQGIDLAGTLGSLWPARARYLALPLAALLAVHLLWAQAPSDPAAATHSDGAAEKTGPLQPLSSDVAKALRQRLAALLAIPEDQRTAAENAELAALREALAAASNTALDNARADAQGTKAGRDDKSTGADGTLLMDKTLRSRLAGSRPDAEGAGADSSVPLVWKRYIALQDAIPVEYRRGVGDYFRALTKEE